MAGVFSLMTVRRISLGSAPRSIIVLFILLPLTAFFENLALCSTKVFFIISGTILAPVSFLRLSCYGFLQNGGLIENI